jgi:membrane fusion protein (multidrug efflux system)
MSTAFSRTLRSLQADRLRGSAAGIVAASALAGGWLVWCSLAKISLYEVAATARIEADYAAAQVQSPLPGRVIAAHLAVARDVQAGEILVELDAGSEQRQIGEQRVRLAALGPQLAALRDQAEAEERAGTEEEIAGRSAGEEAQATLRQAEAPAQLAAGEAKRLEQLRAARLISERDFERGQAEARGTRAAAEVRLLAIRRLEDEQRMRRSDRVVRIKNVTAEISRVEAEIPAIQANIARLEYEVERRRIRAPISGKLGEAAVLRIGAVVQEGEKLGAIVPGGKLAIIAQFPPSAALGRVRPGQPARLRLQGFPWMQYGSVRAAVTRVAGEVRDNSVRVELAVAGVPPAGIPLQHGLPGSLEVEVERVTPAELVLRSAGRMLASPRGAFQ